MSQKQARTQADKNKKIVRKIKCKRVCEEKSSYFSTGKDTAMPKFSLVQCFPARNI